ncbi:MAG TPA: hypothetical protein VM940_13430 [Chthoniobacterales bacterium]|jgi:hypothetical protein|nr:hypothetical protein [Chthoniobacterales bacterium]
MEEIVALFSILLLTGVGWVAAKLCFARIVSDENCIYFAPAFGAGICGVVAYGAVHSYQPGLIGAFCVAVAIVAVFFRKRLHSAAMSKNEPWRLFRFTVLTFLALYAMQILLFGLFSRLYPGPHEVWSLFNMTGTPPPDQMFAWHQAMFADQHRQYPSDPFLSDMDLYDRPQLGGYITLFFFKLFGLPLSEAHFVYPPDGLRFYHCLWWLLNNLYLAGLAPLFRKLFGYRGAIIAVATTTLGGFFFICTAGSWMKFAGAYPFLLAFLLYLENRGPVLQAALCAMSYYIHGSVLPFLAGFGLLQLMNLRYAIAGRLLALRNVSIVAITGVVLVGAWFVIVRWVGSKQPLFYYYIYGAGLTEAQTRPVSELAKAFYDKHTWASLSLFPIKNLLFSWLPIELLRAIKAWMTMAGPISLPGLANALFASQRFCIECGLAVIAAPLIICGLFKSLAKEHSGKVALCIYLVPTLMVALIYRIEWAFSLHILVLYHTLCLFLWVTMLGSRSTRFIMTWLTLVALEGLVCILFADVRLLPANGLHLTEIPARQLWWLIAYLVLAFSILMGAAWEVNYFKPAEVSGLASGTRGEMWRSVGMKVFTGVAIIAVVVGAYSIYCLRFFPR